MKTALQLYSVRDVLFNHIDENLRRIKEMGYDGAEFLDFGIISISEMAEKLKKAGLEIFSIHTNFDEIAKCDENQLELYQSLGVTYMPIGWLPDNRIAGGELYEQTIIAIEKFAGIAKKYGIKIMYHNHDFDLEKIGCTRKLDLLYADISSEVIGAELDTCWIYSGGENPVNYINKYGSRCHVLHLKDCVKEGGRKEFRPLGYGVLDFPAIISAAKANHVEWICVEQDEPSMGKTLLECAKISADYLKTIL